MNIIKQKRELVLQENDIATKQLKDILEKTNKRIERLEINAQLHGSLDFKVMSEMGFSLVKEIFISKGEITSVSNIPEGIITFNCTENYLIELENLPTSLINLDLSNNYIENLSIDNLKNLQNINISHNKFTKLEKLPHQLETIRVTNNPNLTYINLIDLKNLKVLHISNTKVTVIENYPEGVVDFNMDNTPSIEFRNSNTSLLLNTENLENNDTTNDNNMPISEALNRYFELKQKYEHSCHLRKKKIFENSRNKKAAKTQILQQKFPCINCSRKVGTIFQKQNDKYRAICGDNINPCKFNIEIFVGKSDTLKLDMLDEIKNDVIESTNNISKGKLDNLFSYTDDNVALSEYKNNNEIFIAENQLYNECLDFHNNLYNNIEKDIKIENKNAEIYRLVEQNRMLLKEYQKTGNREFLQQAIQLQVNKIIPETKNLRNLKYEIMELLFINDKIKLVQNKVKLEDKFEVFGEPAEVINFIEKK